MVWFTGDLPVNSVDNPDNPGPAEMVLVRTDFTRPWNPGKILLFGTGSILGMAALAVAISLPLRYSARSLTWAHNGLQLLVGIFTLGLGSLMAYRLGVQGMLLAF